MFEEETRNEENNHSGEPQTERVRVEEFEVSGDKVMAKIKELMREGSARRISLKNQEGKTLLEIPLAIGAAGAAVAALLAPLWVAIAAIVAIVAKLKVVVERVDE